MHTGVYQGWGVLNKFSRGTGTEKTGYSGQQGDNTHISWV
jgi:hypothetical protein